MDIYSEIQQKDWNRVLKGQTPVTHELLQELSVGMDSLTGFLRERYLERYILDGGSKIKFVTGRPGSGKTHFSTQISQAAQDLGYVVVSFSAKTVWMHDFREVYLEVLRQCDIETILEGCAKQIVRDMGYDPAAIEDDKTFMDYLAERGEGDPLSKGEIRSALRRYFTKNPLLDNNFACCCSLLTGGILGHPVLESSSRETLLSYLAGEKTVKFAQLRALGLSPARVTKYNARYLLRSLAETIHLAGYPGLLVVIDDMETLLNRSAGEAVRYTKMRREDAFENIRQLIDDIDNMHYTLFLLGFDRDLIDNESFGMKSYQALWMRVQNEVVSPRFNRFADMIDMDRYADEIYTKDVLRELAERLAEAASKRGLHTEPIDREEIAQLIERAAYGGFGIPYLINRTVLEGGKADV